MKTNDLILLDQVMEMINEQTFVDGYNIPKLYLIWTLQIVRIELVTQEEISDVTSNAVWQLFTYTVFELYYREYKNIYLKCKELGKALEKYNDRLLENKTNGIGMEDKQWSTFFKSRLQYCIRIASLK